MKVNIDVYVVTLDYGQSDRRESYTLEERRFRKALASEEYCSYKQSRRSGQLKKEDLLLQLLPALLFGK